MLLSRRQFLKVSAGTVAATAIAHQPLLLGCQRRLSADAMAPNSTETNTIGYIPFGVTRHSHDFPTRHKQGHAQCQRHRTTGGGRAVDKLA